MESKHIKKAASGEPQIAAPGGGASGGRAPTGCTQPPRTRGSGSSCRTPAPGFPGRVSSGATPRRPPSLWRNRAPLCRHNLWKIAGFVSRILCFEGSGLKTTSQRGSPARKRPSLRSMSLACMQLPLAVRSARCCRSAPGLPPGPEPATQKREAGCDADCGSMHAPAWSAALDAEAPPWTFPHPEQYAGQPAGSVGRMVWLVVDVPAELCCTHAASTAGPHHLKRQASLTRVARRIMAADPGVGARTLVRGGFIGRTIRR